MLSLPEVWDYTLKGISQINCKGKDAIRETVWELERTGSVTRIRMVLLFYLAFILSGKEFTLSNPLFTLSALE